ncbi:MAG: hypothetical protein NTX21_11550 [Alphaproteobacteria bacterium]|nr:hypothetical protein [Alphaproteobacteria bacterium]
MIQHIGAVLPATAALIGVSRIHSVTAEFHPVVVLVPSKQAQLETAPVRAVTSASMRAIAIGF